MQFCVTGRRAEGVYRIIATGDGRLSRFRGRSVDVHFASEKPASVGFNHFDGIAAWENSEMPGSLWPDCRAVAEYHDRRARAKGDGKIVESRKSVTIEIGAMMRCDQRKHSVRVV